MDNGPQTNVIDHPALTQALDAFPAKLAEHASASLHTLLYSRLEADGLIAWSGSRLTGDGFPVEITFTTADDRLRYTVEPASRSCTPQQRLEAAVQLINSLGAAGLDEDTAGTFRAMQNLGGLTFGAWIGGRHSASDSQYKIYVEMPETNIEGSNYLTRKLGSLPAPRLYDRSANLRMAAFSPATAQWELYYRVMSFAPEHMAGTLAPAGLKGMAEMLLSVIKDAYGYSFGERLPGESTGISYSFHAGSQGAEPHYEVQSVTLFFFARAFWGGDARIRQQFGRCAAALGWDDSRYQKVTTALASRKMWKTYHGIVGFTMLLYGKIALSIGIRPLEIPTIEFSLHEGPHEEPT
jgi:hypothetical protein